MNPANIGMDAFETSPDLVVPGAGSRDELRKRFHFTVHELVRQGIDKARGRQIVAYYKAMLMVLKDRGAGVDWLLEEYESLAPILFSRARYRRWSDMQIGELTDAERSAVSKCVEELTVAGKL